MLIIISLCLSKNNKTEKPEIFQQYFSSLTVEDMPKLMLSISNDGKNDTTFDIITGTTFLTDLHRTDIKIQNQQTDRNEIKNMSLSYTYSQQQDPFTDMYLSYLSSINAHDAQKSILNLSNRIHGAAILNNIFSKIDGNIEIQQNIIHELVTHFHQGGYLSTAYNIINNIFNPNLKVSDYAIQGINTITSINLINNYTITQNIENYIVVTHINDIDNTDALKYKIKSQLTFSMLSTPNNIYSPISYENIKLTLHFPENMKRYIIRTKPVKYYNKNITNAILIEKSHNRVVYQLPNFISYNILQHCGQYLQNVQSTTVAYTHNNK
ncbi:hypothetical protein DRF75_01210 [Ehrlichia minasensis]|uniref:Uncharacterized protein n=2 Tax=Ehrlichia minasensis TaxID=1242993 RepID=A0A4Q6ICA7_9RICK|nr:hypothetical protein DRF75_01210 [Ehrlichia minasensis]